jgi:hypothetical protein
MALPGSTSTNHVSSSTSAATHNRRRLEDGRFDQRRLDPSPPKSRTTWTTTAKVICQAAVEVSRQQRYKALPTFARSL